MIVVFICARHCHCVAVAVAFAVAVAVSLSFLSLSSPPSSPLSPLLPGDDEVEFIDPQEPRMLLHHGTNVSLIQRKNGQNTNLCGTE